MSIINLTPSQLRQAADLQEKIAKLEKELAAIIGSESKAAPVSKPAKKKGGMSAAGKARIAAAQKLRWAKVKAEKSAPKTAAKPVAKPVVSKPVKKARKKMSAEGRAKIVAAQKARWAKIKAEKAGKK